MVLFFWLLSLVPETVSEQLGGKEMEKKKQKKQQNKNRSPCLSQRKQETPSARRSGRDVTAVARDCIYSQAKAAAFAQPCAKPKTPPGLSSLPTADPAVLTYWCPGG